MNSEYRTKQINGNEEKKTMTAQNDKIGRHRSEI